MFRLPVSGISFDLRPPAGEEDLLLLEAYAAEPYLAAALLGRVAGGIDWTAVPVADVEAALLRLRQVTIGDPVRADVRCTAPGCRSRVDVAFRISQFLAHSAPRIPKYVERSSEEGWFRLRGTEVMFRIPLLADQMAVSGIRQPEIELARRCIRPPGASGRMRARAQAALQNLAPCLSQPLEGVCAECQVRLTIHFDVYGFVLRELRGRAASLYEDIHLIAQRYHWPEARILAMPCTRRQHYAEMILDERGA